MGMNSSAGLAPSPLVGRAVNGGRGWEAAAPEGNYRLSLELKPGATLGTPGATIWAESRATIWAESRRLMLEGLGPGRAPRDSGQRALPPPRSRSG